MSSIGELINEYVEKRDLLTLERRKFEDLEKRLKLTLLGIENEILEKQREMGIESISTNSHTAFQTTKKQVRLEDWDKFSTYLLESGNIHCLEKRPAKLACLELFDTNPDMNISDIGLYLHQEICIQIRKK